MKLSIRLIPKSVKSIYFFAARFQQKCFYSVIAVEFPALSAGAPSEKKRAWLQYSNTDVDNCTSFRILSKATI